MTYERTGGKKDGVAYCYDDIIVTLLPVHGEHYQLDLDKAIWWIHDQFGTHRVNVQWQNNIPDDPSPIPPPTGQSER